MPLISRDDPYTDKTRPLSVGFDAKRAFFNTSGLGNYSRNLLSALAKYYPENKYYLFTPKTKNRYILADEDRFILIKPGSFILKMANPLWRRKYMTEDIKRQKLQIYHGLSQELPIGIEKTGTRSVVTVHDLIFLRFPGFYKWHDIKIYTRKLSHACKVSDRIIAISNQTKEDLISFLNISPDKISVIYQGCGHYFYEKHDEEFNKTVSNKYKLPERYLLNVGTIEERKNLLNVLKAIHLSGINIPLVVVGRKTTPTFRKILDYITANKLNNIIFPGNIENFELPVIYRNAECLIYPSFFEGFGIPLIEALVSKIPAISSNSGCFIEAGGPGSIYIDPHRPEEIGEAILRVTKQPELRNEMIAKGADYAVNFRDDVISSKYSKLYYSLIE